MNLKNKKILITGATGGIGNCLVKKFDEFGSIILATGTNEEKLSKLKITWIFTQYSTSLMNMLGIKPVGEM